MVDTLLFEIGIYRKSPDQYEADRSQSRPAFVPSPLLSDEQNAARQTRVDDWFDDEHPPDFRYNDLVGAIQILGVTSDYVVAEYHFVTAKRLTYQMRKKDFVWMGKLFELHLEGGQESSGIFLELLNALQVASRTDRWRSRYFDLEAFNRTGPLVDWRGLLDSLEPRSLDPTTSGEA
jgi:hypothetical protein